MNAKFHSKKIEGPVVRDVTKGRVENVKVKVK